MKDKFRENFKIALPAALASLAIILVLSFNANITGAIFTRPALPVLVVSLLILNSLFLYEWTYDRSIGQWMMTSE